MTLLTAKKGKIIRKKHKLFKTRDIRNNNTWKIYSR